MNPKDITAVVLTRNEEANVARVLRSLPPGVRALVVDSESTDATVRIAHQLGANVVSRRWEGFVRARLHALSLVETPWVLMIDADEELDAGLRSAILVADESRDAYAMRRDTLFCGKPLRQWRGERIVRLFRPDAVTLQAEPAAGGSAEVHERWIPRSDAPLLDGILIHHSYPTRESYEQKYQTYTSLEARSLGGSRRRLGALLLRGCAQFVWTLLVRGAVLDGWSGIYVAWRSAFYPSVVAAKALA